MSYQEMTVQVHLEMKHSAGLLSNPSSGRVFTTINTLREVICFLGVRSTPLHTL